MRLILLLLRLAVLALSLATSGAHAEKVLRYAFPIAETGFDPAQISDVYSMVVVGNIFESPLTYDYLARPAELRPATAAALPEVSADYRRWVFRIRPGIFFADDPAFHGRRRELTAADYVYSIKRYYDPRWKSPSLFWFESAQLLGLSELRRAALAHNTPFDYDSEVPGLRTLDRYTFVVQTAVPAPHLASLFADTRITAALAREVVEADPEHIMEHPVGTGPYRLAEWRRSSRLVLVRNPGYRDVRYDAHAPAGDARSQAIAARLKGRRLPMIDRVEIAIVEESQPRLLGFLNGEQDWIERLPPELAPAVIPGNQPNASLRRQGVQMERIAAPDIGYTYFAMENPVVGGYTPEKVALRRALALAYDVNAEVWRVRNGQAMPAQGLFPPNVRGYDPALRSEMSTHDLARAQALLDTYGYRDVDGDGWREQPDGSPLELELASSPDQASRALQELWRKATQALGIRLKIRIAKWPEQLKASRNGKLMMWGVAWSATMPDGNEFLALLYGPNKGQTNHARFDLPAYNALFDRQARLPDGPERDALLAEANRLAVAYMPMKISVYRMAVDLLQPWVVGYRRHPFLRGWWQYLDIDESLRPPSP